MTNTLFENCKNDFYRISEMIQLHNTGRHCEYDKDDLDMQLDIVHEEICDVCADFAADLISMLADGKKISKKSKEILTVLYDWAVECKDYCYLPEIYDLDDSYGNGVIDVIGADFYVRGKGCFGYKEFLKLLETYDLLAY
jgi:hypothetical protein